MNTSKTRNWCFTLNNYTVSDETYLSNITKTAWCLYIIFGKETGENGTPHLQGYIELKNCMKLTGLKAKFGSRYHFEPRRGSQAQAIDYCKKDGNWKEFGNKRASPEERAIAGGVAKQVQKLTAIETATEIYSTKNECMGVILDYIGDSALHCYNSIEREVQRRLNERRKKEALDIYIKYSYEDLRAWQKLVINKLAVQDDRTILWVWEEQGNIGKSFLANWLMAHYKAFLITSGKSADIIHAYDAQEIVVFDYARTKEKVDEHGSTTTINYELLEAFKNGRYFSGKYNSIMKIFKPCVVVCFANFEPEWNKLSRDRWDPLNLNRNEEV